MQLVEDVAEVTLPKAWRTIAQLRAQVRSPSSVRQEIAAQTDADASASPIVTIILYGYFARASAKKRSRSEADGVAEKPASLHDSTVKERSSEIAKTACCTPALRRAAEGALQRARASMGNVEVDMQSDAVLIIRACFKPVREGKSSSATRIASAWHLHGVCVAEPLSRAYRAASCASGASLNVDLTDQQNHSTKSIASTSNVTNEQATHIGDVWCVGTTFCGIRLVWVAATSRGGGVAYAMAEVARRCVCYGYEVPVEHVAFSEPTLLGSRFARRYHQRDDFLVY